MRDCALLPTLITFMGITPGMVSCERVSSTWVQQYNESGETNNDFNWQAWEDGDK
jgi:hypothetical protein